MRGISEYFASKMHEMKQNYIRSNDTITHMLRCEEMVFMSKNFNIIPEISPNIMSCLKSKVKLARKAVVDGICFSMIKFKECQLRPKKHHQTKPGRFSIEVVEMLERSFEMEHYPSDEQKKRLIETSNLSIKQINNWFTNKRNRSRQYYK